MLDLLKLVIPSFFPRAVLGRGVPLWAEGSGKPIDRIDRECIDRVPRFLACFLLFDSRQLTVSPPPAYARSSIYSAR